MTILQVCVETSAVIGLTIPTLVFGSTQREHVELGALANEMAKRIAFDGRDWQALKATATITGDGSATDFALPTNWKRMLKTASLWPSNTPWTPLTHYTDDNDWLAFAVQGYTPVIGGWIIQGNRIAINPVLPLADTVKYAYLKNEIVVPTSPATDKTQFLNDEDSFVLDERVLRLGMIWQWRANKGLPYGEDMSNYETALAAVSGADKGSNILSMSRRKPNINSDYAFPGVITP